MSGANKTALYMCRLSCADHDTTGDIPDVEHKLGNPAFHDEDEHAVELLCPARQYARQSSHACSLL